MAGLISLEGGPMFCGGGGPYRPDGLGLKGAGDPCGGAPWKRGEGALLPLCQGGCWGGAFGGHTLRKGFLKESLGNPRL